MSDENVTPLSSESMLEYDSFVLSHPKGWISSLYSWTKVLETAFPQIKSTSLITRDKTDNRICGCLPLCHVRSPLTGSRLVSMPFSTLSDPLVSEFKTSDFLEQSLIDLMKTTKSSHIEIRSTCSETLKNLPNFTLAKNYKCHCIDLDRPIQEIRKSLHRTSVRPYINIPEISGIKIRTAVTIDDVRLFYSLYSFTRKKLFLPSMPFRFFEAIWENLYPSDNVRFLIVEIEKRQVASVMLFRYKDRVSAEAMGWDMNFSKLHIVTKLYWEAIKSAHSEGYKIFDFGRTDPSNKNLMDFKSRWGTYVTDLPVYIYPQSAIKRNTSNRMKPIALSLQKILFGLPNPFYEWVSGFCYRHMG